MNATTSLPPLREDWQRALCVAAHPDDLEYGVSAAVARWTTLGKQVTYLMATRGEAGIDTLDQAQAATIREAEQRQAAHEVGVEVVEFLDHPDGAVEYGPALRRDIARAIRRHRPDVVITGTFEMRMAGGITNQADHRAVGLATVDATRDAGNRWVFPQLLTEDGLPPWGDVRCVCFSGAVAPNCGVDVSEHTDRAIASIQAHRAYFAALGDGAPDPAQLLTWITAAGGARLGVGAAVLFDAYPLVGGAPPWETALERP
jgi:LmbE family N-acetylglucosaminyl deacetylase